MREAVGHCHYPRLSFAPDGSPLVIARQFSANPRGFLVVTTHPTDAGWSAPELLSSDASIAVHNGPLKLASTGDFRHVAIAGEVHQQGTEGHRAHRPEATSSVALFHGKTEDLTTGIPALRYVGVVAPVSVGEGTPDCAEASRDVFFGNPHIHTELSGCRRPTQQSLDFNYRWAIDLLGQDFTGLTDHAEGISDYRWELNRALADFYNFPGVHVAFLSYEWVTASQNGEPCDGHVNVLFRDCTGPLQGSDDPESSSLERLWECLTPGQALVIPHHTATFPFHRTWEKHDDRFQRLVEIFQDRRGNYEAGDAPAPPGVACPEQGREKCGPGGYVVEALACGLRIGFCSGGDHMGLSMTGVHADALTREALFDAMLARHCYGTTHSDLRLTVTCERDGEQAVVGVMGDEIESVGTERLLLRARVMGTSDIAEIALVGSDGVEEARHPCTAEANELFEIPVPPNGETGYHYIRVMCNNGALAWASPIWWETKRDL